MNRNGGTEKDLIQRERLARYFICTKTKDMYYRHVLLVLPKSLRVAEQPRLACEYVKSLIDTSTSGQEQYHGGEHADYRYSIWLSTFKH